VYPTTVTSRDRMYNSDLANEDRQQLQGLTCAVIKWLSSEESNFILPTHEAEGLTQHLGLPTRYIDFSGDPEVAIAFGVGGSEKQSAEGQICVMELQAAISHGRGQIAELCNHRWCERARRQAAYGYGPIQYPDLKSEEAIEQLGLWWFKFQIRDADRDRFETRYRELLDEATDPVAGLLRMEINS